MEEEVKIFQGVQRFLDWFWELVDKADDAYAEQMDQDPELRARYLEEMHDLS